MTNNRDLRMAALNVETARAMYGIQRAELSARGQCHRQQEQTTSPPTFGLPGNVEAVTSNDTMPISGVASWEIDFFGRIRSLKDRALEEYLATEQARRSAQILLVSSVADAYLTLAADRETLKLARTTLESQQAAYDLIKRRYDLGLCPNWTFIARKRRWMSPGETSPATRNWWRRMKMP